MTFTSRARRTLFFLPTLAALALSGAPGRAQQTPNDEQRMREVREYREAMSKRALEATRRRRFEEGKSDTTFPSDAERGARPGVVRAATPAEQKALRHNERGLELFSKGKLEQAVREYEQAISAHPAFAAAHNNLGSAHFAAGRFDEAAAAFRRATGLDADYGQAHFNLALAHLKLGREREAQEALTAALRAYNSAGEAHLKAGRLSEAEESFRDMLRIDPDYAPAHLRLGLVYNASGRFDEAAGHLSRVTERYPANSEAYEALAESLLGRHKYEEAASAAERALKHAPDSPDAHYLAGLARASLGQRDAALSHLAKLQQLNSPDLAQHLSDLIDKKAPGK
ncbi:MAG: tetratricopeptide repeat protein [Acidobacteria bacterium]|nr:tetratricopeptide repeat protein [Acidobacteriota bacterium]